MADASHAVQRRRYVDAVFAKDDPKPALVHFARYTLHGVRSLTGAAQRG
jgi:hypothetical protein